MINFLVLKRYHKTVKKLICLLKRTNAFFFHELIVGWGRAEVGVELYWSGTTKYITNTGYQTVNPQRELLVYY